MTREDIVEKVNALLAEEFEVDAEEFVPDANVRDTLSLDSLSLVDLAGNQDVRQPLRLHRIAREAGMTNYDIKSLIPQREPILLVDALVGVEGDMARTQLTVRRDNSFVGDDGLLAEPGLIEHIAQSASAFAGYKAMEAGSSEPPVGYIGEVKKFRCFRCPRVGEELQTTVTFGPEVGGVSLLTGETCVGEETLACTQMKIYVAEGSLL